MNEELNKYFNEIKKIVKDDFFKLNKLISDLRQSVSFEVTILCYYYLESILILSNRKRTIIARSLIRTLLEGYFISKWVISDKTQLNALRFWFFNKEKRDFFWEEHSDLDIPIFLKKRRKKIDNENIVEKIKEYNLNITNIEDVKEIPSIYKIAQEIGDLYLYNRLYRYFSFATHIVSPIIQEYIPLLNGNVSIVEKKEKAYLTVNLALYLFISMIQIIDKEYDYLSDQSKIICNDIERDIRKVNNTIVDVFNNSK